MPPGTGTSEPSCWSSTRSVAPAEKAVTSKARAELAGMKAPNISRIENDPGQNPTIGAMTKIAVALGNVPQISFKPVAPARG